MWKNAVEKAQKEPYRLVCKSSEAEKAQVGETPLFG